VQIVCHRLNIQTVSLQNEFVCVLLNKHWNGNTFHIHCTCVYCCEYTYALSSSCKYHNTSHNEDTSMISVECEQIQIDFSLIKTVCHILYSCVACLWRHSNHFSSSAPKHLHLNMKCNMRLNNILYYMIQTNTTWNWAIPCMTWSRDDMKLLSKILSLETISIHVSVKYYIFSSINYHAYV